MTAAVGERCPRCQMGVMIDHCKNPQCKWLKCGRSMEAKCDQLYDAANDRWDPPRQARRGDAA